MKTISKKWLFLAAVVAAVGVSVGAFGEDLQNIFREALWARGGLYIGVNAPGAARATSTDKITASYGGSASITPGSITAPLCVDQATTIAVIGGSGTGAKVGDTCELGPPATMTASTFCFCYVSAAGVATVRCCALVTGTPTSGTYYARTYSQQ